jgi:uncharacterized membrane protein
MKKQNFSISEALHFGWNIMKSHLGFFIVLFLIAIGAIFILPSLILGPITILLEICDIPTREGFEIHPILIIIYMLVMLFICPVLWMGFLRITIRFCDNEKAKFRDLFSCFPLFFKCMFGLILYILILSVGLVLLIIPGIIWLFKFQFFIYFIIDKKLGPIKALKGSAEITKGSILNLFLFSLLLSCINILGFLCLFIGQFASIPMTMVAIAFVYRKLLSQIRIS